MSHFTYDDKPDKQFLYQGDIIKITENVKDIIKEVHPYYINNKNKFFMILTQSCDLVLRNEKCKAPYITISAVRTVGEILSREKYKFIFDDNDKNLGIVNSKAKTKYTQFIERLINNNDDQYFYLHKDDILGLSGDYCAILRLSVPLKSNLHYKTLLDGKIIQLKDSFQHKLGYLVGNTYNRVGTEDWMSEEKDKSYYNGLIKRYLEIISKEIEWIEDDKYKLLRKAINKKIKANQKILLEEILEEMTEEINKEKINKETILKEHLKNIGIEPEKIDQVITTIKNQPGIGVLINR
jgi:hypothetical protein